MAPTHAPTSALNTSTVTGGVGSVLLSPNAHQHGLSLARGDASVSPNSDRLRFAATRSASMLGGAGNLSFVKGTSLQAASVKGGLSPAALAKDGVGANVHGLQHLRGQSSVIGGVNPLDSFTAASTKVAHGYTLGELQAATNNHPKGAGAHLSLDDGRTSIEITGISHLKNTDFGV
jgi:hypothetical protein